MRSYAVSCYFVLLLAVSSIKSVYGDIHTLRRLNRLLEATQHHEYDAGKDFRVLDHRNYDVWYTKVIAGHYRQVRRLVNALPDDRFLKPFYRDETARMNSFVRHVDEINQLTSNRLYEQLGNVKDSTFDDLTGFLQREIRHHASLQGRGRRR